MMHEANNSTEIPVPGQSVRPLNAGSGPLTVATLALVNTVIHAVSAQAQATNSPATDANAATQLPDVVVRGSNDSYKPEAVASPKYTEPLLDIPQTITVVPRAVMEQQGATTLRDVLRNVPGISMQAGEGGGGLPGDNLSIRGYNVRSDIFVDGVRDFGAYSRDPFNTEQVEVAKGPSSSVAGRGSTGGAVNLVSKTPKLNPFYTGSFGLGTDDYKRGTVDVNQPLKDMGLDGAALRLNLMAHDAGTPGRDVVKNQRWAVAPSLAFGLGKPTAVTLGYLHMQQNNIPEYGIPWVPANTNAALADLGNTPAPVSYDNFYGLKNYDYEDVTSDVATAEVRHDVNDSLTLRGLFRYDRTDRSSAITAPRFVNANTNAVLLNRQLQRRDMVNEAFVTQGDATVKFDTGPVGHALVAGVELSREEQDNRNSAQTGNQPQADLYNPNPGQLPLGPMPANTGIPNHAKADTLAVYAFDTLKFGEKWELSGGLRWDHVESRYNTNTTAATSQELSRTDDLPSWRVGLVFKPKPNGSVYFGYGTSFNPSIEAGNTGLSLTTNTVALKPEETRSYELGTKWDVFDERLSLSAAIFRTEKVNARTSGINPGDPPTVLDGEQVVQGVELGAAGEITRNWSVFAGYTYLHTEVEKSNTAAENGAGFSNSPEHSFNLWTTYRLPRGWQVGGGAQYVGERLNNLSSNGNVRRAPDYWVFDAMLGYELSENVSLQLNVYNLANERYIDRVGGGHFIPGPGRSAMVTANLKF